MLYFYHNLSPLALLDEVPLIQRTDHHGVRGLVAAVQVEERQYLLRELVLESVNVRQRLDVVKRHLALLVVHVHADSLGFGLEGKYGGWRRGHPVALTFLHRQSPVALRGAHRDPALPVDGGASHAQVPVVFVSHLDLPVVSPGREALSAHHDHHRVEAVGVIWEVLPSPQVSHLMAVLRKL